MIVSSGVVRGGVARLAVRQPQKDVAASLPVLPERGELEAPRLPLSALTGLHFDGHWGRTHEQNELIANVSQGLPESDTDIKSAVAAALVLNYANTLPHDEFMAIGREFCVLARLVAQRTVNHYGYNRSYKYEVYRFLEPAVKVVKNAQDAQQLNRFFEKIFSKHNNQHNHQLSEVFNHHPDLAFIERASIALIALPQLAEYGLLGNLRPESGKLALSVEDYQKAVSDFGRNYKRPEGFKNAHIESLTVKALLSGSLTPDQMLPFSQALFEYQQRTLTGEFDLYYALNPFFRSDEPDALKRIHLILESLRLYQQSRPVAQVQFNTFRENLNKRLPGAPVEQWPDILANLMQPEAAQKLAAATKASSTPQVENKHSTTVFAPSPAPAPASKPANNSSSQPIKPQESREVAIRLDQIQALVREDEGLASGWESLQALKQLEGQRWKKVRRWVPFAHRIITKELEETTLLSALGSAPAAAKVGKLQELQKNGWIAPSPNKPGFWQLTPVGEKLLEATDPVKAMTIEPKDLIGLVQRDLSKLEQMKQEKLATWNSHSEAYETFQAQLSAKETQLAELMKGIDAKYSQNDSGTLSLRDQARFSIERSEAMLKVKLADAEHTALKGQSAQKEKVYLAQQLYIERFLARANETFLKLKAAELSLEKQQTEAHLAVELEQLQKLDTLVDFEQLERDALTLTTLLPRVPVDEAELLAQQALNRLMQEQASGQDVLKRTASQK